MRTCMTAAVALCALGFVPAALAQDQGLSEDQVRTFLNNASQQAEKSVNAGDWQGLQDWARNNVSDDAQFAMKGAIVSAKGGTFTYAGTLSGQQLELLSSSGMMGPRGFVQAMEDYSLEVEIRSVSILPNGDAAAIVHFLESARIDPAQIAQARAGEEAAREGRSATAKSSEDEQSAAQDQAALQAASLCNMRMSSAGQNEIEITVAACDTTMTF